MSVGKEIFTCTPRILYNTYKSIALVLHMEHSFVYTNMYAYRRQYFSTRPTFVAVFSNRIDAIYLISVNLTVLIYIYVDISAIYQHLEQFFILME